METNIAFDEKENPGNQVYIAPGQVAEIIPDADMRFCLIILKDGSKHFVCGTIQEVREKLGMQAEELS